MCTDSNGWGADIGGDGCDWYIGLEEYCGWYDDSDFHANEMCCTCQTDYAMNLQAQSCYDVSFGAEDSTGDGCEWYDAYPSTCGDYDTDWFWADLMCCSCNGGLTETTESCTDNDTSWYGDSTGDSCGWYDSFPSTCGDYDTDEFFANEMCCSCGGGVCQDTDGLSADTGGDSCEWYVGNEFFCGWYDTDDFHASEMCCTCIENSWAVNLHTQECYSTDFYGGDTGGDGCGWYDSYPGSCGSYDTDNFWANSMCCACNGGLTWTTETAGCTDNNTSWYGDATGDGCEWYDSYPSTCGQYDTYEFYADSMCCSCGGGWLAAVNLTHCDDDNTSWFGDATGDGCEWYDSYPSTCGSYDTYEFYADSMCCSCGGGACHDSNGSGRDAGGDGCEWYTDERAEWGWCGVYDDSDFVASEMCCTCKQWASAWSANLNLQTCSDSSNGFGDSYGDGCDWYDSYPSGCGGYDTADFSSYDMCCSCGGGLIEEPLPTPEWEMNLDYDQLTVYADNITA